MQDCYFYTTKKDGDLFVVAICCECHAKNPDLGWFWQGSVKGYGPFLFECDKCRSVIYDPKDHVEDV